jgi:hypothetical protein
MHAKRQNSTQKTMRIAFCGMMTALSVVLMLLGGLVPVMLYISPLAAGLLLLAVLMEYGRKAAWLTWLATALCVLMIGVDKEAAFFYVFVGYYPILKPKIETMKGKWLWKLAIFNSSMVILYSILIRIMGITEITGESEELAGVMLMILLLLGNVTFLALDRLLTILQIKFRRGR